MTRTVQHQVSTSRQSRVADVHVGRRDDSVFIGAIRHSRRVRLLKIALPAAAILMASAFVARSYMLTPSSVPVDIDGSAISNGKLVMANPKLDGYTKDNQPFAMTALRAIQELSNTGEIHLERIDAKFPIDAENFAIVKADTGLYREEANTLDVTSPVTLTTSNGMSATLKSAFIDIGAGELDTPDQVVITNGGSSIRADSFKVLERGKVFVFDKRVRMTIEPPGAKDAKLGSDKSNAGN